MYSPGTELNVQGWEAGSADWPSVFEKMKVMPQPQLPTGTLTFLFTDIANSTRLWEEYPDSMKSALARHDLLLRQAIETNGGYVFKTVGDAFCSGFPSAEQAILAALAGQRALHNEALHSEPGLQVRMALHSGTAEERDGDYFGPSLNRVARILAAGHGGQVLLSLATRELVRDHLPAEADLLDMGQCRLKDLSQPEHIFQLAVPDMSSNFPPLRTLDAFHTNLPIQPTPLVGRQPEVAAACEILRRSDARLLTLTGPGGTGKTRLGLQIAAELLEDFEHGIFFVALASISDPALTASTIAQTLGIKDGGSQAILENLKNYLHDKQLLLVLDNFEQLVSEAALIAELLTSAPRLKVLVTSREILHLYHERELAVPPLRLPDSHNLPPLETLLQYEAVALFVQRTQVVKPNFVLNAENAATIVEICQRLDGLPLAIELAAARGKVLPPTALLARLTNRLKLLTSGPRDLPERQQTLRGAIDWSYDLLEEPDKRLFARLAVFVGGCGLEAAEAVCNAVGRLPNEDDIDVLDGLASLVSKSLVRQVEQEPSGEPRFVMLETIREYALERLLESGQSEQVRRWHAEYYLEMAEKAEVELRGPKQADWLIQLDLEHDNMRAVLDWGLETTVIGQSEPRQLEIAARTGAALSRFWEIRGYLSEGRERLTRLLDLHALLVQVHKSVLPFENLTSPIASINLTAGRLAYLQGDYDAARPLFETSLALYQELQVKAKLVVALKYLGDVAMRQSDYKVAARFFEDSLVISLELGQKWDSGSSLNSLGLVDFFQGDFAAARRRYERSLLIWEELGDKWASAMTLSNMGAAAHQQGDYTTAKAYNEQSRARWQELGDRWGVAHAVQHLGLVAYGWDDLSEARRLGEESLTLRREIGDRWGIARSLSNLGLVAYREDNLALARAQFEESLAIRRNISDRWGITDALVGLGLVDYREGNYSVAQAHFEEGLVLAARFNLKLQVARLQEGLVVLAVAQGQPERAARLGGAVDALREVMEAVMSPHDQSDYTAVLDEVRNKLGEQAFTLAWKEGRAWSMDETIRQVLGKAVSVKEPETPAVPQPTLVSLAQPTTSGVSVERSRGSYPAGLTAREVEVLRLVALGLTNSQVAKKLIMAPRTVNVHLTSIYGKLDVSSRTAAARYALDHKLV